MHLFDFDNAKKLRCFAPKKITSLEKWPFINLKKKLNKN